MEENPFDQPFSQSTFDLEIFKLPAGRTPMDKITNFRRESLGILPTNFLLHDSFSEDFGTPRESLGILNLSALDLGRDSVAIFNVNKSSDNKFGEPGAEILSMKTESDRPQIMITTTEYQNSPKEMCESNSTFLLPSQKSCTFSGSSDPSFDLHGLRESSRIFGINFEKDEFSKVTSMDDHDIFNEAFLDSIRDKVQSLSYKTDKLFNNGLSKGVRQRIQSLPFLYEDDVLRDGCKTVNRASLDDLYCRGVQDVKQLEDSVFMKATANEDEHKSSQNSSEKSFDNVRYLLDSTPQPNWDELDLSKSSHEQQNSPLYNDEKVAKAIDKMLGMQPLKLEQGFGKSSERSPNLSANISRISRASQCNLLDITSENLSKASLCSEENIQKSIRNLSDILTENEHLSKSQREEGHQLLGRIASLLSDVSNSEDSGHSSVTDDQFEGKVSPEEKPKDGSDCNEILNQPLDLSLRGKQIQSNDDQERKSELKISANGNLNSVNSPLHQRSVSSGKMDENLANNRKSFSVEALGKSKFPVKGNEPLKRTNFIVSKKEPLRAVLPVEKMTKIKGANQQHSVGHVTPDKKGENTTAKPNKAITPLQETKLKPMAASTPTDHEGKRSSPFFYPSPSKQESKTGNGIQKVPTPKPLSKMVRPSVSRRNSFDEGTPNIDKDKKVSAVPKLKRSFSLGKETKAFSGLPQGKQNLLHLPYYKPKSDKMGSDRLKSNSSLKNGVAQMRDVGKENLKPSH